MVLSSLNDEVRIEKAIIRGGFLKKFKKYLIDTVTENGYTYSYT